LPSTEKLLASVLELCDSNDVYMTLDILLLTSKVNKNKCQFEIDFIHEIVESKEKYIGIPLVCERAKLEKGKYKYLGHALKKDGTFQTEQIGSFIDFSEKETEDGTWELYGQARVLKRYPKVCSAILELFEDKLLSFSVEVLVGEYKKTDNKNIRVVPKSEDNLLMGDCIVSFPAEQKSKCQTLIAEAINKDLGGDEMKDITFEEFFENTRLQYENSELDIGQVQRKVYAKCRDLLKEEFYCYSATDFGVNYIILQNWDSGDYFKGDFSVADDDVALGDLYKVVKNYVPVSTENPELSGEEFNKEDKQMDLTELQAKLEASEKEVSELKVSVSEKETEIAEKDVKISEKETEIAELTEKVNTLSESVVLKDNEIAELLPVKEEMEKINAEKAEVEKAKKVDELKAKYSKLLSEEILSTKEISEAIENLEEAVLQAKVTDIALEKAEISTKNESKTNKMVTASISEDIKTNGNDNVSKYITINR